MRQRLVTIDKRKVLCKRLHKNKRNISIERHKTIACLYMHTVHTWHQLVEFNVAKHLGNYVIAHKYIWYDFGHPFISPDDWIQRLRESHIFENKMHY